ncbi:MAG TPA: AsmA family protein [Pseudomonadales bacterium]|nr:AsmA family protein [Pseudomonadales bacterium]
MRALFIGLGVLLLLVVIGVVVLTLNLDRTIKSAVESVGPTYTGTEVRLDSVSLSLLAGRAELKGLVVGQPEGYVSTAAEGESSVRVGTVSVSLEPMSVFEDTIIIREVLIDGASINAIVRGTRDNNLQAILDHVESVTGPTDSAPADAPGKQVIIDHLVFSGASATATVGTLPAVAVRVPDLVLDDIGREQGGASIGRVLEQVLQPLVGAIVRAASEGQLRTLLQDKAGDLGERLREGAGGLMDKIKGLSPFGSSEEPESP